MKYAHLLMYVASRCWALHPDKLAALLAALKAKATGADLQLEAPPDNGGVAYLAHHAKVSPAKAASIASAPGRVAVLPVRGVLTHRMGSLQETSGNTTYERLGEQLRALVKNPDVKAVVLDINSPGGVTDGIVELAEDIRSLRGAKPIVGAVNTMAASAAYWLAAQLDDVAVTPSGAVGSIGVYTVHEDISALLEREGIRETLISAGKYKTEGNPYEPLGDEAREAIQADVDSFYDMFVADVAIGRNVSIGTVGDTFGQGRMVLAEQAVKRGMADRVATLEQTLNRFGASLNGASAPARARAARTALRKLHSVRG